MTTRQTTPKDIERRYVNNVRVDFNAASPTPIRVDFSLGPFYSKGDFIRLVDLDPCAGHVLGRVVDVKKTPTGMFAFVEWSEKDIVRWSPSEFDEDSF